MRISLDNRTNQQACKHSSVAAHRKLLDDIAKAEQEYICCFMNNDKAGMAAAKRKGDQLAAFGVKS